MVKVLLADDDPLTRAGIKLLLSNTNYQVAGEAEDGLQVLDTMAAARPDLVAQHRDALGEVLGRLDGLADVRLPRLSKSRRNRLAFGLDGARREVRRALDALAPQRSG